MTLLDFLEYVKAAGGVVAPIFAILFWLERDERKGAQKELREVSEQSITAITEMKSLIAQLTTIFRSNGGA